VRNKIIKIILKNIKITTLCFSINTDLIQLVIYTHESNGHNEDATNFESRTPFPKVKEKTSISTSSVVY